MMNGPLRTSLLLVGSALVVACSAAPEDVGAGGQDLATIGGIGGGGGGLGGIGPIGGGPAFPPANAQYCPTQWTNCSLQVPWAGYSEPGFVGMHDPGYTSELAELSAIGCDKGMYFSAVGTWGRVAVCWDTPQARAAFQGYLPPNYLCSACVPLAAPGQIYIGINLEFGGDCPSSCPTTSGTTTRAGGTITKAK